MVHMFVKFTAQHIDSCTIFLFFPPYKMSWNIVEEIGISYPCYSILNAYYYFISPRRYCEERKKWNVIFIWLFIEFVNKSGWENWKMFCATHRSCRAFRMGRAASRGDFEDLGRSWRKKAFLSDPLNRSGHPFAHRPHRMRQCHCCWNPRRCFAPEATEDLNAAGNKRNRC